MPYELVCFKVKDLILLVASAVILLERGGLARSAPSPKHQNTEVRQNLLERVNRPNALDRLLLNLNIAISIEENILFPHHYNVSSKFWETQHAKLCYPSLQGFQWKRNDARNVLKNLMLYEAMFINYKKSPCEGESLRGYRKRIDDLVNYLKPLSSELEHTFELDHIRNRKQGNRKKVVVVALDSTTEVKHNSVAKEESKSLRKCFRSKLKKINFKAKSCSNLVEELYHQKTSLHNYLINFRKHLLESTDNKKRWLRKKEKSKRM